MVDLHSTDTNDAKHSEARDASEFHAVSVSSSSSSSSDILGFTLISPPFRGWLSWFFLSALLSVFLLVIFRTFLGYLLFLVLIALLSSRLWASFTRFLIHSLLIRPYQLHQKELKPGLLGRYALRKFKGITNFYIECEIDSLDLRQIKRVFLSRFPALALNLTGVSFTLSYFLLVVLFDNPTLQEINFSIALGYVLGIILVGLKVPFEWVCKDAGLKVQDFNKEIRNVSTIFNQFIGRFFSFTAVLSLQSLVYQTMSEQGYVQQAVAYLYTLLVALLALPFTAGVVLFTAILYLSKYHADLVNYSRVSLAQIGVPVATTSILVPSLSSET